MKWNVALSLCMFENPKHERSINRRGGIMRYTDLEIKWVFNRTAGSCLYCGTSLVLGNYGLVAEAGAWDINCFIPRPSQGEQRRDNLVPACVLCDALKGGHLPWEFDAHRFREGDENPDNYISGQDIKVHYGT